MREWYNGEGVPFDGLVSRLTCFSLIFGFDIMRQTKAIWLLVSFMVGCVAQMAERRSLAGELTLSYARPVAVG